ncbi:MULTISPECIES: hypothetical protein [unclassified Streptomyces]|nr:MULTISPECIES: hypothetical protein [unclassified Streptomyces]MCX5443473.1 hypothetical protein [Streptomyces sp. NBC_00063]WUB98870.1 hypothetical protein OHO83_44835 [Streptomyces sp. NBC_00569]
MAAGNTAAAVEELNRHFDNTDRYVGEATELPLAHDELKTDELPR